MNSHERENAIGHNRLLNIIHSDKQTNLDYAINSAELFQKLRNIRKQLIYLGSGITTAVFCTAGWQLFTSNYLPATALGGLTVAGVVMTERYRRKSKVIFTDIYQRTLNEYRRRQEYSDGLTRTIVYELQKNSLNKSS